MRLEDWAGSYCRQALLLADAVVWTRAATAVLQKLELGSSRKWPQRLWRLAREARLTLHGGSSCGTTGKKKMASCRCALAHASWHMAGSTAQQQQPA
ncbi:hypothetical protein OEZ85_000545 [Tetradesmus obliquus]|uniref:Uncharacterized protein n=1 Tax=Tetradesmus obliquus TaxID=3088 RepID=A0ABY8UJ44_TETOB|nr:hypothetical protein OEZ85_000545 [Tetradesmus obliquus]